MPSDMTAEGQRQDVNSLLLRAIRLGSSEKDDRNDYDWIRVNKKKFFSGGILLTLISFCVAYSTSSCWWQIYLL